MHPNSQFSWDDRDALRSLAREVGFGMIFAATADGPRVAHVPFVFLGEDRIGFHLARGNALVRHLDGMDALCVVNGPDAYVSPDWYGLGADQVPTWNYLALEMEGLVRRMSDDELTALVDALTEEQESRLAPKARWTRHKMAEGVFDKLHRAICGFEMRVTAWRGTVKLGQNKPEAARTRVAEALEKRGQRAMAHLMRELGT